MSKMFSYQNIVHELTEPQTPRLSRIRIVGFRGKVQSNTSILLKLIATTISPVTLARRTEEAMIGSPEHGSLTTCSVGEYSKRFGLDHILISAGVVVDIDFFGISSAVWTGESVYLE